MSTSLLTAALAEAHANSGGAHLPPRPAQLLAGLLADIGLLDSRRNHQSFDRAVTPPEREALENHPTASARLAEGVGVEDPDVLRAIEYHHERIDGSGYPLGLGGDAIPPLAGLLGLADAYMTLVSERPRHRAVSPARAIELLNGAGFDSEAISWLAEIVPALSGPESDEPADDEEPSNKASLDNDPPDEHRAA